MKILGILIFSFSILFVSDGFGQPPAEDEGENSPPIEQDSEDKVEVTGQKRQQQVITVPGVAVLDLEQSYKYAGQLPDSEDGKPLALNNLNPNAVERAAKFSACYQAREDADETCDPKKSKDIHNAMGIADGFRQATTMGAMMSQQGACSGMGQVAFALSAASGAFKGYCSKDFFKCQGECSSELEDLDDRIEKAETAMRQLKTRIAAQDITAIAANKQIEEDLESLKQVRKYVQWENNKCQALSSTVAGAAEAGLSAFGMNSAMASCQKATGLDCKASPNNPVCLMLGQSSGAFADCSTAAGQSNPVCICQRNPAAPQCAGGAGSGSFNSGIGAGGGTAADGGNLALAPFGGPGGLGGDTGMFPTGGEMPGEPGGGVGASLTKGGSARGNAQESGGGNNGRGGAPGGGGPGGSGINTKIIGGYGVGSGGGGSGGGGYYGSRNSDSGGYGGRAGVPNLRQFLPGGKMDPARAIAGETGPDGITGPNTDIWKKVKTRYYAKKPSLLP
jgi:hypothetical protein